MDQLKETDSTQDLKELITEVLKVQELILHRIDKLEHTIATLKS